MKRLNKFCGFTLVELVVTMMLIGILALVAIPRFSDNSDFNSRTFHDEVLAALRYGQKAAIASRRNVCVTFGIATVTLNIALAPGDTVGCGPGLVGPTGTTPFTVTAKSGATFTTLPANFRFDALGRTNIPTQTFGVTKVSSTITVEQETGYVHF